MTALSHDYLFIRQPAWMKQEAKAWMNVSICLSFAEQKFHFYLWDSDISEVRWMTSFDTTKRDVKNFVKTIKDAVQPA
jgi:Holliday junction resolvase RusA-like endonuclease